jgi:hypothetical protein
MQHMVLLVVPETGKRLSPVCPSPTNPTRVARRDGCANRYWRRVLTYGRHRHRVVNFRHWVVNFPDMIQTLTDIGQPFEFIYLRSRTGGRDGGGRESRCRIYLQNGPTKAPFDQENLQ